MSDPSSTTLPNRASVFGNQADDSWLISPPVCSVATRPGQDPESYSPSGSHAGRSGASSQIDRRSGPEQDKRSDRCVSAVGLAVGDPESAAACLDRALEVAKEQGSSRLLVIGVPTGLWLMQVGAALGGATLGYPYPKPSVAEAIKSAAELARRVAASTPLGLGVAHFGATGWRDPVLLNRLREGVCDPLLTQRQLLSVPNRWRVSRALARCGAQLILDD